MSYGRRRNHPRHLRLRTGAGCPAGCCFGWRGGSIQCGKQSVAAWVPPLPPPPPPPPPPPLPPLASIPLCSSGRPPPEKLQCRHSEKKIISFFVEKQRQYVIIFSPESCRMTLVACRSSPRWCRPPASPPCWRPRCRGTRSI